MSIIHLLVILFLLFLPRACSLENLGFLGDFTGGCVGTIVAFIALYYTHKAFKEQTEANRNQRADIALERFETNLFSMISLHEQLTSSLKFINEDIEPGKNVIPEGRALFEFIYNRRQLGWHKGLRHSIEEVFFSDENHFNKNLNTLIADRSLGCLDHYFAHLLAILNYIDQANIFSDNADKKKAKADQLKSTAEKRKYVLIVVSALSEYELLILYYYVLLFNSPYKESFKNLIEKYAIFETLRIDRLARDIERRFYHNMLDDSENSNLKIPTFRYNKSAFVFNPTSPD